MQTAYIGMGGNVESNAGAPAETLAAAVEELGRLGNVIRRSSLYLTEPVGYADQARFVNAVVELETGLSAHGLLQGLLEIEHEFGRDRSKGVANGPRTLDLDLLIFGEEKISDSQLEIPHPRMMQRSFVLIPLGEIAPHLVDNQSGMTVSQLVNSLNLNAEGLTDAVVPIQSKSWSVNGDLLRLGGA